MSTKNIRTYSTKKEKQMKLINYSELEKKEIADGNGFIIEIKEPCIIKINIIDYFNQVSEYLNKGMSLMKITEEILAGPKKGVDTVSPPTLEQLLTLPNGDIAYLTKKQKDSLTEFFAQMLSQTEEDTFTYSEIQDVLKIDKIDIDKLQQEFEGVFNIVPAENNKEVIVSLLKS